MQLSESGTRERIVAAALVCVARVGVGKTTLDDVAQAARCSRATVYRYFDSKESLLASVVATEAERLGAELTAAAAPEPDLSSALTASIVHFAHWFDTHDALQVVIAHEPELVLPCVTFDGCSRLLEHAGRMLAGALDGRLPPDDAERFCEWTARLVLSHLLSPSEHLVLRDPESVHAFVDEFLVPTLTHRTATEVMR
jgi:AcrR family transcriptional regulator